MDTLKEMSVSDLTWKLVPLYGKKAEERTRSDILKNSRFTKASAVSQRDFANLEHLLYFHFSELDFVELSPLQPLGLNCVLAKTNGKKLIPTIRGNEVNSDATTALFLEAYKRFDFKDTLRIATNARTVRPKVFTEESKFLSHFKVFAEVSIGIQSGKFGQKEVDTIAQHLADELAALRYIKEHIPNNIKHFNVFISNLFFLRNMLHDGDDSNLVEEAQKLWYKLNLPEYLLLDKNTLGSVRALGFKRGMNILEMFLESFYQRANVQDGTRVYFHLARTAGMNYYRHIAYRITAEHENGLELDLADGGSTNWGITMSDNKQIYTVSSGIGTELLIQNFLRPAK